MYERYIAKFIYYKCTELAFNCEDYKQDIWLAA